MTKEELIKNYPWIEMIENNTRVLWYDMLPEGWRIAFGELFFSELNEALLKTFPEGIPDDFHILDIKEKWGKLRVSLSYDSEYINDVLFKYEYISSFICIDCGAPYPFAQMTYGSWVMPLCERCYVGNNSNELNKWHTSYLQTVLRDSISVRNGPEDKISVLVFSGKGTTEREIEIKSTWEKIFNFYVERTIV